MEKTFTTEFMIKNKGCYRLEQLNKCSFMQGEITLDKILNSEIRLKDKFWFVCKKLTTKQESQLIAIGCAEIELEIYEKRFPKNKAPREAIQAAKDYLAGTISIDNLRDKRDAADAAAYAAAAAAAYAAYAAAADAGKDFNSILLTFLINFCKDK